MRTRLLAIATRLTNRAREPSGLQIGYNFDWGGHSIYTNLRAYVEYRRLQGHAVFVTGNIPLAGLFQGHSQQH